MLLFYKVSILLPFVSIHISRFICLKNNPLVSEEHAFSIFKVFFEVANLPIFFCLKMLFLIFTFKG